MAAPPDLLMLTEGASLMPVDDVTEGQPLLPREFYFSSFGECGYNSDFHLKERSSVPFLYAHGKF